MIRLAYLPPAVLEKLLIQHISPAVSIKDMAGDTELP